MKGLLIIILCLVATPVDARPLHFRGQFLDTYIAADGFLDSLPAGVEFGCEEKLCSFSKAVRIYVFENNGRRESFWSTDFCDVMFDEAEKIRACGDSGHFVYHDETNQLLLRRSSCDELEQKQTQISFTVPSVALISQVR